MKVFLFDMDGVLIQNQGYRAAFIATMNYFGERMGIGEIAPALAEIEGFEAQSITNEWDMIALSMAEAVVGLGAQLSSFPTTFDAFLEQAQASAIAPYRIDYGRIAQKIGESWNRESEMPAETALRLHNSRSDDGAMPILRELLTANYEVLTSPTTRIFQHYTLGSAVFEQTYGAASLFETPSLLQLWDETAVSPQLVNRILQAVGDGSLHAAIYTARPSLPPAGKPAHGYAPEAELAAGLTGLESLPLLAAGKVNWLSAQMGKGDGVYIKPSPVQALAGIGAALSGDEEAALWAAEASAHGKPTDFWHRWMGESLEAHVFEDASGGIQAVQKAGAILREIGLSVRVVGHGIAAVSEKVEALTAVAEQVYPSVNEALRVILSDED